MRKYSGAELNAARIRSRSNISFLLVTLLLAVILSVATSHAQLAGKGTVQGVITDQSGAVIPGVSVSVTDIATNITTVRNVTDAGSYSVSLDPGTYSLTVSAPGFKTLTQGNVHVNGLETLSLNMQLAVGIATDTVEVSAAPPQVDTSSALLGATLQQEMYSELPVLQNGTQRRATDFVALMPGVNAQPTNGGLDTNTGVVNGSGSRGAVAGVYIEGVPITSVAGEGDPRFIWTAMPVDSINQFQVATSGYPAIYEGQGVLNYDVKRGSNHLHGTLFEFFRNTALDTWGFMAPGAAIPTKPVEHQNEYGLTAGMPIIKDKLFLFGSYDGFRYVKGPTFIYQSDPTAAMLRGDFSQTGHHIYDPASTTCTGTACTRTAFPGDVIPINRLSPAALYLQKFLPSLNNQNNSNNYLSGHPSGLSNWSTSDRVDYNISPSHNVSAVLAAGRQSTTAPAGLTGSLSSTQNQAPPPYISTQQFFVKTKVAILEDTYVITPHVINQLKFAFGRYDSTGTNQDISSLFSAAAAGIQGLPSGQAAASFPTVTFSGNTNLNRWGGYSSNRNTANGNVIVDNVQWQKGKHSLTLGGEIAWMQYNFLVNASGVNPLQLAFNSSETAKYKSASTSTDTTTGDAYASFLLGAANSGSFTLSSVPETGARFRPISPYVQDNWRITPKLTLDLGLRWDIYTPYHEAQDRVSWMDPKKMNTLVNFPGALSFGGSGASGCNCSTPVNTYLKNFGPRLGFAFQLDSKTVIRGSWGVMYTHGDNVGGSATSRQGSGLLGFSASPKTTVTAPGVGKTGTSYWQIDQPYPAYAAPPFLDPTLGTFYTTASSAASQSVNYADPYNGGRAPEYVNWSFGLQHQVTRDMSLTLTYVGSEGHFVFMDSNTARGLWINQLDPKYLSLGTKLSNTATPANLAAAGITAPFPTFSPTTGTIAQALRPFPQYNGVSDIFGAVGNTSFHALELVVQQRMSRGLTFMGNYTWSKSMDNAGTFRSGYDIPAAFAMDGQFHKARSLDRSLSLSDQPHRVVLTGVYELPFGKGHLGGGNRILRAALGGWKVSEIFQAFSGSPLAIVMNSCNTNPSQSTCEPVLNPAFSSNVRINGNYGSGVTAAGIASTPFLDANAFIKTPDYKFSTLARTNPLGLRNSGNYNLDSSLRRIIPIKEGVNLSLQADMFNVTNHTRFGWGNNATVLNWGAADFGTVSVLNTSRDVQLAAHIEF